MIAHDRPAGAAAEAPAVSAPVSSAGAAQIEIVLGGVIVRLHGAADAEILAAVLRAVKAAT